VSLRQIMMQFLGITLPASASATLTEEETAQPLARFFEETHQPARVVLNSLNALPAAQTIPVAAFSEAAAKADILPCGYHRFRDKTGYVHAFAAHNSLSGEMLAWLLPWLGEGDDLRFKLTYPGFHASAKPSSHTEELLCVLRCALSIGADVDGAAVEPIRLDFRFLQPQMLDGGGVFPSLIAAGGFTTACFAFVLTPLALHAFVWLGDGISPLLRGFTSEKRLYDIARHCAFATAHITAILPDLYAYATAR